MPWPVTDGSGMKSLGADRNQQGRLGKVLIWGAVRAVAKGFPRARGVPSVVIFRAHSDYPARWYYICVHLALWHGKQDAASILVKPYILCRKENLWGEVNWFARHPDPQSPISPCHQIIHLSTPRATLKFKPGRNQGLFVAVGWEKLAKCILK